MQELYQGMPYYMQQTTTDNTIGNDMFSQQKTLESIILPKTIKSIEIMLLKDVVI